MTQRFAAAAEQEFDIPNLTGRSVGSDDGCDGDELTWLNPS